MTAPTFCSGIADIESRYGSFIVDQWGVLHDGHTPYPDAIDCLVRLRADGKQVVLLSNSGKRAAVNRQHLLEIGIGADLYGSLVTSGEATWRALRERTDPFFANLGQRCVLWSRSSDLSHIEGLPFLVVERVEEADFLLLAGIEDDARLEQFGPVLEQAASRHLPMICANPDMTTVQPSGAFGVAPGVIARHYEDLGGQVGYVGKPHRPVYELCLDALGRPPPNEVLAIGDSVVHDIVGGAAIGLDTALIISGIHAPLFDLDHGPSFNAAALDRLCREYGATPDWVLPRFRWLGL